MTVTLLLHCPDRPGIIADITNFITENRGNVVYLAQFVDHVENVFNTLPSDEAPKPKWEIFIPVFPNSVYLIFFCF